MNPNYYAIIPSNVRYDKRLKPLARLMYGEITALSNTNGYCYAGNAYFANLYGVSNETVSRWISSLVNYGYVKRNIKYVKNTKQVDKRYLSISPIDLISSTLLTKKSIPSCDNNQTPIDEIVKDNNTSINNTSINKEKNYKSVKKEITKGVITNTIEPVEVNVFGLGRQQQKKWDMYWKGMFAESEHEVVLNWLENLHQLGNPLKTIQQAKGIREDIDKHGLKAIEKAMKFSAKKGYKSYDVSWGKREEEENRLREKPMLRNLRNRFKK